MRAAALAILLLTATPLAQAQPAATAEGRRSELNRLLDETDTSLTLATLASAAAALGKRLSFELLPA